MLKGLNPLLVPELLAGLAEMGHGDQLAVVDRNFPAHRAGGLVVELPCSSVVEVLDAVLSVLPVDAFTDDAVIHMLTDAGEESPATPGAREVWTQAEKRQVAELGVDRRTQFYDLAADAYLTIRTGETLPYGCYLVRKGVI